MSRQTNVNRPQLICIIVDTSGSMREHGKAEGANNGVKEAIMECQTNAQDNSLYKILLITFDNEARVYPGYDLVDCNEIEPDSIDIKPSEGATNITAALRMAHERLAPYMDELQNHPDRDRHPLPLVLLLTDGMHSKEHWPESPSEIAGRIKSLSIGSDSVQLVAAGVATPGIPNAVDATSLAEIASPGCSATIEPKQIAEFIAKVSVSYTKGNKSDVKESVEQFQP